MFKRVFLLVLDGLGVGSTSDAEKFGDVGANTLLNVLDGAYNLDVLEKLGLTTLIGKEAHNKCGIYMKANPINNAKDSINGHYELMGAVLKSSYKTYPDGFPNELINEIERATGHEFIGNIACDGEKMINDFGEMHIKSDALIIYTSADSVLQIAAHEDLVTTEELYRVCEIVKDIVCSDKYKISRVIARPFTGKLGHFARTNKRRDFSLDPPINALDLLNNNGVQTICLGKIPDLFNNHGVSVKIKSNDNIDTMLKIVDFAKGNFEGLLFANLNDFDSVYGHRRDKDGYLNALEEFNYYLPILLKNLKKDDLLIITSDHGNDPTFKGSDHTREMVPILIYSPIIKGSKHLADRETLADVGATILHNFGIKNTLGIGRSIFLDLKN